jgi:hypothetical protein
MPGGRPKSADRDKRTEAVQALLTIEEKAAFDALVLEMSDELGVGRMSDGMTLRRLILAELRRRGLYPPGAPKPNAQPEGELVTRTERSARAEEKNSKKTTPQASRGAARGGQQTRASKRAVKR